MPQKTTHIAFGIFLFTLLWNVLNLDFGLSIFVGIGAMFPDLDLLWKHRKLLHNFLAFLITSILVSIFTNVPTGFGFLFGCSSHLLLDSLSPMGVWPLWPIKKEYHRKLENPIITTGASSERYFGMAFIFVSVFLFLLRGIRTIGDISGVLIGTAVVIAIFWKQIRRLIPKTYR